MLFGLAPQLESQVAEEQQPGLQTPSSSAALLDLSGTHKHTKGRRLKHHRGLSEKCPQNTRRQPQIYAGERRRIDYVWSNILLYYSSDVTLSLSLSLCFIYLPPAGLFTGSLGNATDWLCCLGVEAVLPELTSAGPQLRPRAGRESTSARKKSPPAAPSGSGDRPRCALSDRGD